MIDNGFNTLYRSVVLNIVNGPGEFIQTRGRKMGGRLHIIGEILEASLVRGSQITLCHSVVAVIFSADNLSLFIILSMFEFAGF